MILLTELRWQSFLIFERLQGWGDALGKDPEGARVQRRRQALAKRRVSLRALLRRSPQWSQGHVRLGFVEIDLHLLAGRGLDPRTAATIRVCGEAAARLCRKRGSKTLQFQARYLPAACQLFSKNYVPALQAFEKLLSDYHQTDIDPESYFRALENAAAAAMAIGEDERAVKYLDLIPASSRSDEARLAVSMLSGERQSAPWRPTNGACQ